MNDTNAKIRGWLAEHRLSYAAFAALIEMPYDTFKVKMSGKTEWKLSEIERILKFTGCTFDELF